MNVSGATSQASLALSSLLHGSSAQHGALSRVHDGDGDHGIEPQKGSKAHDGDGDHGVEPTKNAPAQESGKGQYVNLYG